MQIDNDVEKYLFENSGTVSSSAGITLPTDQSFGSSTTTGTFFTHNPNRTLVSTEIVGDTVEQIFHCSSSFTLAVWPPRDNSWYEKETRVVVDGLLVVVSCVKGNLVPAHYEWADEDDVV